MASTYVNDLRLNEMATGDQSGSWGTVTNTNLELIGEAFSYGTEAITTNADTHTTTIADGASDPGRAMFLKYTGSLDSACTITIGPNTVSKMWFIENATSGSQNIIISQGSGANVTIAAGQTKAVYSDGAGAGAAFVDAFDSLSVGSLTSTGIDVTGTVTADGLSVDGDGLLYSATNVEMRGNANVRISLGTAGTSGANNNSNWIYGNGTNLRFNNAGGFYSWETLGTERTRIDSSGNLLVGKTTSSAATPGHELKADGAAWHTADSTFPLFLNRETNDGELIRFRKDNSNVGSIASISNDLVIYSSTASHAGLSFGNTRIEPTNNQGVIYNGGIDLGNTDSRFKDIYLAGGAYLGGTGAANKLEDYEEGTWTPTISAVGGGTVSGISLNEAYYTKIGRQVNFYLYLSAINLAQLTTGTYVILSGLPFASSAYSDFNFTYMRGGTTIRGGYIQSGQSYIYLCDSSGAESQQASNHLLTAFIGAGSYMTNA